MKYIVSALLGVSLASAASAQSFTEMEPAGPWQVNYSDHSCELGRVFQHDDKTVELQIKAFDRAGGNQQIIVASKDISLSTKAVTVEIFPVSEKVRPMSPFKVTLQPGFDGKLFVIEDDFHAKAVDDAYEVFLQETPLLDEEQRRLMRRLSGEGQKVSPAEASLDANMATVRFAGHGFRQSEGYKTALAQSLASVESLRFSGVFVTNIALKTGPMVSAVKALDDCIENLHTHWGIDTEAHKTLTRPAIFIGYADFVQKMLKSYPMSMAMRGQQAVAPVRVHISAEGQPTACFPLSAGANLAFNQTVCDVFMNHAKFTPALDAAGKPMASFYTQRVSFGTR